MDGQKDLTGSLSPLFLEYVLKGVQYVICTDVDKDGMMKGPSTDIYRKILENTNINLIASGGITSLRDIDDIRETGCEGAIIGKAVYEGKLKLKEAGKIMLKKNNTVSRHPGRKDCKGINFIDIRDAGRPCGTCKNLFIKRSR